MKTFKRLFALFLALFAVVGLTSCVKAKDGFSINREQKIAEIASLNEVVDEIDYIKNLQRRVTIGKTK